MGCLRLAYKRNDTTLKVAYSVYGKSQNNCTGAYRYGFNGKEKDDEVKGGGNSYDFCARIYDSRLGRWLSTDPLQAKYADVTPYHFTSDNPINRVDVDGKDDFHFYYVTTRILLPLQGGGVKTLVVSQASFYTVEKNNKENTYTIHHLTKTGEGGKFGPWQQITQPVNGVDAGKTLMNFDVSNDYPVAVGAPNSRRKNDMDVFKLQNDARNSIAAEKQKDSEMKLMGLVASIVVPELLAGFAGEAAVATELSSFEGLLANPKAIWGKSADEVGEILGEGWTKSALNEGKGWKYTQDGKDGFVSFSEGSARHGNSPYYKINTGGSAGKTKVVGEGYKATNGEKSKIIQAE